MVFDHASHHRHRLVEFLAKQANFDDICETSAIRKEALRFETETDQARVDATLVNL